MELVNGHPPNDPIEINGVDPLLFEADISNLYTGEIPDIFTKDTRDALSLLDVANKFGFTSLKLKLDFELATHLMTPTNAAELLAIADSHCCALLKEAVMKQLNSTPYKSKSSEGWKLVQEFPQLLEELWYNATSNKTRKNPYDLPWVLSGLSVSSLYHALEEVGLDSCLDLHGSRDMLVMRLQERLQNLDLLMGD